MVTLIPSFARNAAHVRPAGPPPTTATFLFFFVLFSICIPLSIAQSDKKASILPISTGVDFIPLVQPPWHCLVYGQILPHTEESTVVLVNTLYASSYLFCFISAITSGISLFSGHLF